MDDGPFEFILELDAVNEHPLRVGSADETFRALLVVWPFGNVHVDPDSETEREIGCRGQCLVGACERSVQADHALASRFQVALALFESAFGSICHWVGWIDLSQFVPVGPPISDPVRGDNAHSHHVAAFSYRVEGTFDGSGGLVVIDDRGGAAQNSLGGTKRSRPFDHLQIKGVVESPPNLFESADEVVRLLGRRRHAPRKRAVQMMVRAHKTGGCVSHRCRHRRAWGACCATFRRTRALRRRQRRRLVPSRSHPRP